MPFSLVWDNARGHATERGAHYEGHGLRPTERDGQFFRPTLQGSTDHDQPRSDVARQILPLLRTARLAAHRQANLT